MSPLASVSRVERQTSGADEDQASAGAQFGPTALLHPWKDSSDAPSAGSMRTSARGVGGWSEPGPLLS
jgi:hypothetical protein